MNLNTTSHLKPIPANKVDISLKKSLLVKSFASKTEAKVKCILEGSDVMAKNRQEGSSAMSKLVIVTLICFFFMAGEVVGGIISGSIAIMTDAAHMLSDVAGFTISYVALYLAKRPASHSLSYGFHRAEILGALASIMLIWGLIVWLFVEAIKRIVNTDLIEIDGEIMLITSCVGLACNFLSLLTLHYCGGHSHSHGGHSHGSSSVRSIRNLHPSMMSPDELPRRLSEHSLMAPN
jgi:zinc transporter 2